ncbi:tRNA 2-thiouridine(34) synthase MnmA [Candidatus Uhrbacteria bacterium RIFOXYC12_FULL_57_11]|nr:MAG: tRNA 2-thiouridine(34) synthase MnmA [Candidatus Uhrbacteria bacterium RIFOXYC12_FULL_57_11]
MSETRPKVLVGMSGGVDSSVAAALLLDQGYEVIGAFMKNWTETKCDGENRECGWREERRDAMRVAAKLGIPFVTFDFEKEYRDKVVDNLFQEYAAGRTPNPDVLCNKYVKFDLFVKEADKLGCAFVATGHYARIEDGRLLAGSDPNKDQTYFLWAIPRDVLPRVLFPVGGMQKPVVRDMARTFGLPTADKKDSTGICFVGEVDIRAFLKERIPEDPGDIVTITGEIVGTHEGVAFYTIGQRHGLNVGGGMPYYVVDKKPETKQLIVSSNFHPQLFGKSVRAFQANWFCQPKVGDKIFARVRYRQPLQACVIVAIERENVEVAFDESVRAVTPGQSIVFYDGEEMLGGAIIR